MSTKKESTEQLEKKVVVNEVEATDLVQVEENVKTAKLKQTGIKVLKIAGVATVGVIGFLLGTKAGKNSVEDDQYEVEYEVVETNEE